MDVRSQAPFIARSDRDPGSPLPGRERPDSSGSDAANRTWPAGSWCVDSSGGCGSVQVCRVVWSGLPPVHPVGPPKPLPCHLPSSVWRAAVKSLQRGVGQGWEPGALLTVGTPPPPTPLRRDKHLQFRNTLPSSAVLSFLARQEVLGVSFWVFFWDICDAWWWFVFLLMGHRGRALGVRPEVLSLIFHCLFSSSDTKDFDPKIQGRAGSRHRPQGHAPLGSLLFNIDAPAFGFGLGVEGSKIF